MEGQFLVRQIYDDEITYNLIQSAVDLLRKFLLAWRRYNCTAPLKLSIDIKHKLVYTFNVENKLLRDINVTLL